MVASRVPYKRLCKIPAALNAGWSVTSMRVCPLQSLLSMSQINSFTNIFAMFPVLKANPPQRLMRQVHNLTPVIIYLKDPVLLILIWLIYARYLTELLYPSIQLSGLQRQSLPLICCVNKVVCVRKPGPIAEVAIRKAAPNIALRSCNGEEL
jgi:hypothetical protein